MVGLLVLGRSLTAGHFDGKGVCRRLMASAGGAHQVNTDTVLPVGRWDWV